MIDTIRLNMLSVEGWKDPGPGWSFQRGEKLLQDAESSGPVETSYRVYKHEETGLRVGGSDVSPRWAEVSLPHLVYGSNGILLKERDCAAASAAVRDLVHECVRDPGWEGVSRLDLVGQFQGDLRQWNEALRRIPHRRVRRSGLEFFDSGMVWPGKNLHVRLYDKGLEQTGKRSSCVRLEFQARGKLIPACCSSEDGLSIDYEGAYGAYRRFCLGFNPKVVPIIGKLVDLFAWCNQCGFQHEGMTPTEMYLRGLSARHERRIRAQLLSSKLRYFRIDWDRLVPEMGDAPFIDFVEAA